MLSLVVAVVNANAALTAPAAAVDDDDDNELVNDGNCDKCIPVVSFCADFL